MFTGHKDFYPNNGMSQPGCILSTCDHSRAWEIYAESINFPNNFPGKVSNIGLIHTKLILICTRKAWFQFRPFWRYCVRDNEIRGHALSYKNKETENN